MKSIVLFDEDKGNYLILCDEVPVSYCEMNKWSVDDVIMPRFHRFSHNDFDHVIGQHLKAGLVLVKRFDGMLKSGLVNYVDQLLRRNESWYNGGDE